jgi:hypothetical protein
MVRRRCCGRGTISSKDATEEEHPTVTESSTAHDPRYTTPSTSALPIPASLIRPVHPIVSYKDQTREHADAVPLAVAVERMSTDVCPARTKPWNLLGFVRITNHSWGMPASTSWLL